MEGREGGEGVEGRREVEGGQVEETNLSFRRDESLPRVKRHQYYSNACAPSIAYHHVVQPTRLVNATPTNIITTIYLRKMPDEGVTLLDT